MSSAQTQVLRGELVCILADFERRFIGQGRYAKDVVVNVVAPLHQKGSKPNSTAIWAELVSRFFGQRSIQQWSYHHRTSAMLTTPQKKNSSLHDNSVLLEKLRFLLLDDNNDKEIASLSHIYGKYFINICMQQRPKMERIKVFFPRPEREEDKALFKQVVSVQNQAVVVVGAFLPQQIKEKSRKQQIMLAQRLLILDKQLLVSNPVVSIQLLDDFLADSVQPQQGFSLFSYFANQCSFYVATAEKSFKESVMPYSCIVEEEKTESVMTGKPVPHVVVREQFDQPKIVSTIEEDRQNVDAHLNRYPVLAERDSMQTPSPRMDRVVPHELGSLFHCFLNRLEEQVRKERCGVTPYTETYTLLDFDYSPCFRSYCVRMHCFYEGIKVKIIDERPFSYALNKYLDASWRTRKQGRAEAWVCKAMARGSLLRPHVSSLGVLEPLAQQDVTFVTKQKWPANFIGPFCACNKHVIDLKNRAYAALGEYCLSEAKAYTLPYQYAQFMSLEENELGICLPWTQESYAGKEGDAVAMLRSYH